jgi:hypothetical protein
MICVALKELPEWRGEAMLHDFYHPYSDCTGGPWVPTNEGAAIASADQKLKVEQR